MRTIVLNDEQYKYVKASVGYFSETDLMMMQDDPEWGGAEDRKKLIAALRVIFDFE